MSRSFWRALPLAAVPVLMLVLATACGTGPSAGSAPDADDHEHEEDEDDHEHPDTPEPGPDAEGASDDRPDVQIGEFAVPSEGANHIDQGEQGVYEHYPPSSGQHHGVTADWGVYSIPVPPEVWIHNLEHSGIAVLYNCPDGCPNLVDGLTDWARNAPHSRWGYPKVLAFPDDQIERPIVALAWGWELNLDEFDAEALTEFYLRHVDQGPEDVP